MDIKELFKEISNIKSINKDKLGQMIAEAELTDSDRLYLVQKFSEIPIITYKIYMKILVKQIKDIKIRIEGIKLLDNEFQRLELVQTLPENEKIKFIDTFQNYYNQREVLDTIKDENVIITYLNSELSQKIKEETRAVIICTLKNNIVKINFLQNINDEMNKALVISTLTSDKQKMALIFKFKDERAKNIILSSLRNSKNIEEIPKIKQKYQKAGLPTDMTFGMEIESEGPAFKHFYEMGTIINEWITKREISLEEGIEVVSKPLNDNIQNVTEIYTVNKLLKLSGQRVSYNCGGHIHIGADYLKSKKAYINLLELYCNCEKIIYLISNAPGDIIDKDRFKQFCMIFSADISKAIKSGELSFINAENNNQFINQIVNIQKGRDKGINFKNVGNERNNTIEFRIPNGTLNPNTWIENVRLFGRLIEVSEKLTHEPQSIEEAKDNNLKLQLKESLKKANLSDEQRLEILLEILFTEEEKEAYRLRYEVNSKVMDNLKGYEQPFRGIEFPLIDFGLEDFASIAEKACISEVEDVRRESMSELSDKNRGVILEDGQRRV